MKKRLPLVLIAFLVLFIVWMLRPMRSHVWDIEFDTDLQDGKDAYLSSLSLLRGKSGRPNVVLIMADDLGLTDISLYGSPHLSTPNIDSIGYNGIVYEQAYSSAPICSPSRSGLLTGRYQNRYGFDSQPNMIYARTKMEYWFVKNFMDTFPMVPIDNPSIPRRSQLEKQGVPPSEIMLSEALNSAGYRTDIIGKWHLGYGELQHPNNRGFDDFYGFLEAFSRYIDPKDPEAVNWRFDMFHERHIWKRGRKGASAIQRNGITIDEEEHLTDAFAREAVARIQFFTSTQATEKSGGNGTVEPFFLYLPFSAPHTPFQALGRYEERFSGEKDAKKRIYYAMIAQLDDAVGKILDALEAGGVADNTLVIFTSDNGGASYTGATGNDPLRGGKMSHFEGGISVPLMMSRPGKIKPGSTDTDPVIQMDLFNTILDSASVPLPDDRVIDGINLLDPTAKVTIAKRPLFWRADYNRIVRYGEWKLLMNEKSGKRWLFNLGDDREELMNLAGQRPDMVAELEALYKEWDSQMQDAAWPRVMDYYFEDESGSEEEAYWFAI